MPAALWGCTWAQRCIELNTKGSMLTCSQWGESPKPLQVILWGTFNGHPSDSFLHKTKNLNLMMTLMEESGDHQGQQGSSSDEHEFLYNISWQSVQYFSRYSSLDQSDGLTDPQCQPQSWLIKSSKQ